MTETYIPIACGLHSEYELLAMHQARVQLCATDDEGNIQSLSCHVQDIKTHNGAEYLVVKDNFQQILRFRLDRIRSLEK